MKLFSISVLFFTMLIFIANAQNVHWGGVLNVTYNDNIYDIKTDKDNSLIICGQFSGTVDFDHGPGVANMTAAGLSGEDIFVAKYDSAGNYLWSHGFGTGFYNDECDRLAVDTAGNIFITGMWNGTIDFNPDPGTTNDLTSNTNSRSRFLAKYDTDGNYLAARNVGNAVGYLPSSQDGQSGLGCDDEGNVYMGGFYGTSLTLAPGTTLSVSGLSDNYVAKFNAQLDLIWAFRLGSTMSEYTQGIYVHPSGKIIALGSFGNTVDFDPGPGVFNMTQLGSSQEGYFASYDSSGQFLFAKQLTSGSSSTPIATFYDSKGRLIVTGSCAGVMDADPDTGVALVGDGFNDQAFVAAYDSLGNYRWAFAYGDVNSYNAIRYAGVDTADNIYVAGNYNPMMDINPGTDTAVFGNIYAAYVSSFDTSGNFRTAFKLDEVRMCVKDNDIYLAGNFYGLKDFDPGPQVYPLQSDTANASWYLLRLHQCDNFSATPGVINFPAICAGDTVTFSVNQGGPQYLWELSPGLVAVGGLSGDSITVIVDSTAIQETVFVNSIGGCLNSPMVYSNVTINHADVPIISQAGDSLFTNSTSLSYQWFLAGVAISGANDSIYAPLVSGVFTVMITDSNGCAAISDPFNFVVNGISSIENNNVIIFPNPFNKYITISITGKQFLQQYVITDVSGKIIFENNLFENDFIIHTDSWAPGIYTLKLYSSDQPIHFRLVKY